MLMKASEIIAKYNLIYDWKSKSYTGCDENHVYEMIAVNNDFCILFCKYSGFICLENTYDTVPIENDLPAQYVWKRNNDDKYICSRCGSEALYFNNKDNFFSCRTRYCPVCGASMNLNYTEDI